MDESKAALNAADAASPETACRRGADIGCNGHITPQSINGVSPDTAAARRFLYEVAGGTAAASEYGRPWVLKLKKAAQGTAEDCAITDEKALRAAARRYGVPEDGRGANEIAAELAEALLHEFTEPEGYLRALSLAPPKRQAVWEARGVRPHGADRMVAEAIHRAAMDVDYDYKNILRHAFGTALSAGWGGARAAAVASDILSGAPSPVRGGINLDTLREETVNIVIYGHAPTLSKRLAAAAEDPEIKAYAKAAGAKGVTVTDIGAAANEWRARGGVPAGDLLPLELAIATGAVEMVVMDERHGMPTPRNYHTEIIPAADMARAVDTVHSSAENETPRLSAQDWVRRAIGHFKNRRRGGVRIPTVWEPWVAGFSAHAIKYMLGGRFRASFRMLNDAVIQNRILGVAGIAGGINANPKTNGYVVALTNELIKNNVLVLETGGAANAKAGNLAPFAARQKAGPGLQDICEAVGIPPVLRMGGYMDSCRILETAAEMTEEGGLGEDLSQLPIVGIAPDGMNEMAAAIGGCFVASGIDIILGHPFYTSGGDNVQQYLCKGAREDFGARFYFLDDPLAAAEKTMEILTDKREKLGINQKTERKLYDMKDRRDL